MHVCFLFPLPGFSAWVNELVKKRIQFLSFILWTISWTNARNNTMLLFLNFLRVILSRYFVGACSWDGSSHSSELYSSWVCTNALHWFHCRQSGSCKFTFSFGFDVFQWSLKKNSCWPVLDSIGFLITVEKVHWG